ncbi:hypothetical protein ABTH46_19920, partial [Acinetobacter baumannii]
DALRHFTDIEIKFRYKKNYYLGDFRKPYSHLLVIAPSRKTLDKEGYRINMQRARQSCYKSHAARVSMPL